MALAIKRILILEKIFELEQAVDGFDAGRKVVVFKPDIVILYMKMLGMDGFAVAKRIKEVPGLAGIKVIAISAFFDDKKKEKIFSFGADSCLDKPFSEKELLKEINNVVA